MFDYDVDCCLLMFLCWYLCACGCPFVFRLWFVRCVVLRLCAAVCVLVFVVRVCCLFVGGVYVFVVVSFPFRARFSVLFPCSFSAPVPFFVFVMVCAVLLCVVVSMLMFPVSVYVYVLCMCMLMFSVRFLFVFCSVLFLF